MITMVTFLSTQLSDSQGHGLGLLWTLWAAPSDSDKFSVEAGASPSPVTRECSGAC